MRRLFVVTAMIGVLVVPTVRATQADPVPDPVDCLAPAGDPAPGTQAWRERDAVNQWCATQRLWDEYANPAFGTTFWSETPSIYLSQVLGQAEEATHPRLTLAQWIPGGTTADPYRTLDDWTGAGRGRVTSVTFHATDGALLHGYVFEPPSDVVGPYPAVVITTGSIQGYQNMYFYAAEGLAEAGYMVLTYDVQGQGRSETFPGSGPCTSLDDCPGVPFQQDYNFFQGTEDALDYLFSSPTSPTTSGEHNPAWADLDPTRVGLAGHSLGASAVSQVGQVDTRVKAIVAWDNLSNVTPPPGGLHTPALGINAEYFFNPQPMQTAPDEHAKDAGFRQLEAAGVDTMQVALRSSTHLEFGYVPYILPASRLGERVTFYYTLAWFDRYLKDDSNATSRLTATTFDDSSDVHSIGAGRYDPVLGNQPYEIGGQPVADRLSIYYASGYSLEDGALHCSDMRRGC